MPSTAAGSDNQLSGCHNLSQVRILHFSSLVVSYLSFAILFSRLKVEFLWTAAHWATCSQSVQHSKRASQETLWPGGFGLYTRHTLLRGDVHHCSTEGEPLPCLLSCSKVCCMASNTSNTSTGILILGMPWGGPWRVQTHMSTTAPWALTNCTSMNPYFKKAVFTSHQIVRDWKKNHPIWLQSQVKWLDLKDSSVLDKASFMLALLYLNLPICLCTVVSIVTMPTVTPMM